MERNLDDPAAENAGKELEGLTGTALTQAQRDFARLLGRLLAERWRDEQRNRKVGESRKV